MSGPRRPGRRGAPLRHRKRWTLVLLAAAIPFLLFFRLGGHALLDPDEARLARISAEMFRGGDFVLPHLEGAPTPAEPPLLHWLQARSFQFLGLTPWGARLPGALATMGSILLLAWVTRRRFGDEGAFWAASILATMPLVLAGARVAGPDAVLAVHVLAVLALELGGYHDSGGRYGLAVGALLGLAFLAKGPAGVLLPLVLMLAGRTASGQDLIPRLRTLAFGAASWCVVVLPSGLALVERAGAGATWSEVRDELLAPYFAGTGHVQPPWYYAGVLLLGFAPWAGPLVIGLLRALVRARDPESKTALYAASSLLAGLLFLSIGKDKGPGDLLPLAPLAAIVVTWELGQEIARPDRRRWGGALLALTLVTASVTFSGFATLGRTTRLAVLAGACAGAAGVGALAALTGLLYRRPRLVFGAGGAAAAAVLAALVLGLPPIAVEASSAAPLVREVPALAGPRPVVIAASGLHSLALVLDRAPERIRPEDLGPRLDGGGDAFFVLDDPGLRAVPPEIRGRLRTVGRWRDLSVLERVQPSE